MLKNTFRELLITKAEKQSELVDSITDEARLLGMMPMQQTSSGITHQFERLLSVSGPGIVDFDSPLPSVDVETELGQAKMTQIAGEAEVGEDKLRILGQDPAAYFSKKIRTILKSSAQAVERSVIYNYLRGFAIDCYNNQLVADYSKHLISAGGSGSTNHSIVVVKWEEDQLYGLYNQEGLGRGELFDIKLDNNGALRRSASGIWGYGMRMKMDFGVLQANPRNVASIVNIDISDPTPTNWSLPTQYDIDKVLNAVRYNGNTMMIMHPNLISALSGKFKSERVEIRLGETNLTETFDAWNGVPIIPSWNMSDGAEPAVTVA